MSIQVVVVFVVGALFGASLGVLAIAVVSSGRRDR